MQQKLKGLLWVFVSAMISLVLALGIPRLAAKIPFSFEKSLASALPFLPAEAGECFINIQDRLVIDKIIGREFPLSEENKSVSINVKFLRGKTENAFSYLGGQIFVFGGLFSQMKTPEEFAGILAHEIEHVVQRHVIQGSIMKVMTIATVAMISPHSSYVSRELFSLFLHIKYSVPQERQADLGALNRLKGAHIDTSGLENFFKREEKTGSRLYEAFSDHPSNESRVEMARSFKTSNSEPVISSQEWDKLKKQIEKCCMP